MKRVILRTETDVDTLEGGGDGGKNEGRSQEEREIYGGTERREEWWPTSSHHSCDWFERSILTEWHQNLGVPLDSSTEAHTTAY